MDDRLQRRNPIVQFIFDYWIYVALVVVMWQLPYWLADFYNDKIEGFDTISEFNRWLRFESGDGANQTFNWLDIINNFYIVAILAMSYNLAFGFTGIISLGHALFFGVATYAMIVFIESYDYSVTVSAAGAILLGVLFGLILSLAVLRIKGVYFAMFSLALSEMFFQLSRIRIFEFLTGGDDGIRFSVPNAARGIAGNQPEIANVVNRLDLYEICAMLTVATFVFIRLLMASQVGKVILAIRENEDRARTMGYNVVRYKTLVLVLSCGLAAMAGALYSLRTSAADPVTVLGVGRTIDPLLMTIIGGTGTNPGPILGAFVLEIGEEFFRDEALRVDLNFVLFHYRATIDTVEIWPVILGIVFILIVLLIPYGIVGQANLFWIDIRRWVRTYLYNPIVRSNHQVATLMKPITGESPAVAVAFAEQSADKNVVDWARSAPLAALYTVISLAAIIGGIVTLEHQTFMTILLFLGLITSPFTLWVFITQKLPAMELPFLQGILPTQSGKKSS